VFFQPLLGVTTPRQVHVCGHAACKGFCWTPQGSRAHLLSCGHHPQLVFCRRDCKEFHSELVHPEEFKQRRAYKKKQKEANKALYSAEIKGSFSVDGVVEEVRKKESEAGIPSPCQVRFQSTEKDVDGFVAMVHDLSAWAKHSDYLRGLIKQLWLAIHEGGFKGIEPFLPIPRVPFTTPEDVLGALKLMEGDNGLKPELLRRATDGNIAVLRRFQCFEIVGAINLVRAQECRASAAAAEVPAPEPASEPQGIPNPLCNPFRRREMGEPESARWQSSTGNAETSAAEAAFPASHQPHLVKIDDGLNRERLIENVKRVASQKRAEILSTVAAADAERCAEAAARAESYLFQVRDEAAGSRAAEIIAQLPPEKQELVLNAYVESIKDSLVPSLHLLTEEAKRASPEPSPEPEEEADPNLLRVTEPAIP
jgi:hypothetical protein